MPSDARIFIAGGGPVGLAAAVELRRRGYAPRIVDPDPAPSPESRALAINPRTLDLLEPSGVTEALLAAGQRVRGALVRVGTGAFTALDFGLIRHRFPFLLSLPQSDTERLLAEALQRLGGRLERETAVAGFTGGDGPLEVRLTTGEVAEADLLIGADGAHSAVRKALGLGFPGESEPQAFGLADVELDDWPHPWDHAVATLRDDHVIGFIPIREGMGRFVSSRPDTLAVLPPEARPRRVVWESVFRISYRQVESYQRGSVFLAGDAAHIHSPVGGRGMNLGIEDACWLAWLIETGRTADYTRLRHPVGAAVLRATAQPTSLLAARSPAVRLARSLLLPRLARVPWLVRRFLEDAAALNTPAPLWLPPPGSPRRS